MIRVFVVGSPRGGTTIAQRLISEKGQLFTHPETKFFQKMVGGIGERVFPSSMLKDSFLARYKTRVRQSLRLSTPNKWPELDFIPQDLYGRRVPMRKMARIFANGFDAMAEKHCLFGWIEKTPEHLYFLDEINRYITDARIVHIVRNGRDVVSSRKDAARRYNGLWERGYSDLFRNVHRWNADTAKSAGYVGDKRHLFVDYDTFCDHTEGALKTILQHIGIDHPPASRENNTFFSLAKEEEEWKRHSVAGEVVKANSKWMHVFSEEERAQADEWLKPIPIPLKKKLEEFSQQALEADRLIRTEDIET